MGESPEEDVTTPEQVLEPEEKQPVEGVNESVIASEGDDTAVVDEAAITDEAAVEVVAEPEGETIEEVKETVIESIQIGTNEGFAEVIEESVEEGVESDAESSSEDSSSSSSAVEAEEEEEEKPSIESIDPESENYIKYPDNSFIDISQIIFEDIPEPEPEDDLDENGHFRFPKIKNPGLDEAFNHVSPPPVFEDNGIERYKYVCESLKVFPIKRFLESLKGSVVNLRYYGVDCRGVRAIAEALARNKTVKKLDLEDNWLSPDAVYYLGEMLQENLKLTHLNLTGCRIGPEGASMIKDGVSGVRTLEELNLSWNNLGDEGMEELAEALAINFTIKKLDLSHNKLGNPTAILLGRIMEDNEVLEDLDLSFNYMFDPVGLKVFFTTLVSNQALTRLSMAWNALSGREVAKIIKTFLTKSELITHLNLSNNRFEGKPVRAIKAGMNKSVTLESMDLSFNPMGPKEANALLTVFLNPNSQLTFLGLDDVYVEKNFLKTLGKVKLVRECEVTYAGVLSNYVIQGADPNKLMFARAIYEGLKPKKKKKKREFGHVVLQLAENEKLEVPMDNFIEMVKATKIVLDDNLMLEIGNSFGVGKNKVDLLALRDCFMGFYPDTVLPEKKEKKKKKKKGKGKGKKKK